MAKKYVKPNNMDKKNIYLLYACELNYDAIYNVKVGTDESGVVLIEERVEYGTCR